MRKILVILTMLVLLISCGKKGSKNDPFKDLGNNKGGNSSKQVNEVEKYNLYVGVHNELLSLRSRKSGKITLFICIKIPVHTLSTSNK